MMTTAKKLSLAMHGAVLLLTASLSWAADMPPDLTGVWTNAPPAAGAAGGGGPGGQTPLPPMLPDAQKRVDAYQALVRPTGATPGGSCLGTGMPGSMLGSGGYPMEIIQRPEQITVVYEAHAEVRRIYFGDRNAEQADRVPGRNGYSSGHWEGDTLVVETDNLVEQVDQRYAHSDQATIVERYRIAGTDDQGRRILEAEMTMTDPAFYTAPVKMTKRWAQVPNGRLLPYECAEEIWDAHLQKLADEAGVELP